MITHYGRILAMLTILLPASWLYAMKKGEKPESAAIMDLATEYTILKDDIPEHHETEHAIPPEISSALLTVLAWANKKFPAEPRIVLSLENGQEMTINRRFESTRSWKVEHSSITELEIWNLLKDYGKMLHRLTLNDCRCVSDSTVSTILQYCPALKILNLTSCDQLTDGIAQAFVNYPPQNLKELDLTLCYQLTDASLLIIVQNCPELSKLNMYCCPKINEHIIEIIRKERSINIYHISDAPFDDSPRGMIDEYP